MPPRGEGNDAEGTGLFSTGGRRTFNQTVIDIRVLVCYTGGDPFGINEGKIRFTTDREDEE